MGVVDDEHRVTAVFANDAKLLVDLSQHGFPLTLRLVYAQLTREAGEYPTRIGRAIQDDEHTGVKDFFLESVEQAAHDHRLAATHIAGQNEQAFVLAQAAIESRERISTPGRVDEVSQTGLIAEGILGQSEVLEMLHGVSSDE